MLKFLGDCARVGHHCSKALLNVASIATGWPFFWRRGSWGSTASTENIVKQSGRGTIYTSYLSPGLVPSSLLIVFGPRKMSSSPPKVRSLCIEISDDNM
jgi:hypothetical protein